MDFPQVEQKEAGGAERCLGGEPLDVAFGVTMMVMGMGVTLITLYLLGLVIGFLIKLFPFKEEEEKAD